MELIKVSPVHEEIIGILTKNNLSYSEAVEALRTTEIVLGRIILPETVVIKKEVPLREETAFQKDLSL